MAKKGELIGEHGRIVALIVTMATVNEFVCLGAGIV